MANWNIEELRRCPNYEIIGQDGPVSSILYDNEPFCGKPTKVFAYLGLPDGNESGLPAMVCLHGGGGTAFKEWVQIWNKRGYAAISMDFSGRGPDGERLPDGGPEQDHDAKFNLSVGWENLWTYHAIAAVARGNSILRSLDRVDESRIGVTGISWGGYLTCITAGVDDRFACAIPVYGCGFLQDNSADEWMQTFERMTADERTEWHRLCDPSSYLGDAHMPVLFITGTNDFAYPLDSLKKSYSLVPGAASLCVRLEMPHSHPDGWAPEEIYRYADHHLCGGRALPRVGDMRQENGRVIADVSSESEVTKGYLLYTSESGKWSERKWCQVSAELGNSTVSAAPPKDATVFYVAVEDEYGAYASSPHIDKDIAAKATRSEEPSAGAQRCAPRGFVSELPSF